MPLLLLLFKYFWHHHLYFLYNFRLIVFNCLFNSFVVYQTPLQYKVYKMFSACVLCGNNSYNLNLCENYCKTTV